MNEKTKALPQLHKETSLIEDPGLTESLGSFPVWMLRIIDVLTPEILIQPPTPKKKSSEDTKE